jgi:hypothetical protein
MMGIAKPLVQFLLDTLNGIQCKPFQALLDFSALPKYRRAKVATVIRFRVCADVVAKVVRCLRPALSQIAAPAFI